MHIHNFFGDVLKSIRILFDKVIYNPNTITHYEFNIANRTFTLAKTGYKPNYEFPNAIITLNDDNYIFGERPTTIQQNPLNNYNQIKVLIDRENLTTLYLQEEQVTVNISVQINCESQLHAKNMEFQLRRYLPVGKYINLIEFTTFLDVSPNLMKTLDIDYNRHEIVNLFTIMDNTSGRINYYFGVHYRPLIRLENSSVSISSATERSFPVNVDLSYQLPMPVWVYGEKGYSVIEQINIDFTRLGHEPISENSMRPIYNPEKHDKYGNSKLIVKRNLLIHNEKDFEFLQVDDRTVIGIKFAKDDFIISPDYRFNMFTPYGRFKSDVKPVLVDEEINQVNFEWETSDWNREFKPDITSPLIVQFVEVRD